MARASKKDPVAALVAIEKELEKDPFNGAINDVLHDTCLKVNLLSTAAFALETAKKGNPENTKLSHKLANFYILRDMHAEAAIVYQDIVRQDQSDGAAIKGEKDCSAKASMQKNNLSESSSFRDIIKSDEAAELEMASRSALTKDQLLEKVGILAAKYQEDPNNLNVVKDLAATYEQLEDWASAQQFFDWAHQVSGGDVALRSKAEAMGDKSKALGIADLEAQAAADPDNADLQSQLVEIKAGRLDERLVECKQRVDQNPTDPKLRYELGYAFYDAGKHSEAIPHLQQATRNPHIRTKVLLLLGRTFYAKGMVDLAIKQLSDANAELIAMDSTKKEILFELGVIYHDADRKDEGLECFKQIYEIDYGYRDVAARVEGSYQG